MDDPYIQIAETGAIIPLRPEVTTVGRGARVDVRLDHPSVSLLHAEIIRRGPYVYVSDLGLSQNGTRVNGRLVARRVLSSGDALAFGSARCRIAGLVTEDLPPAVLSRISPPELTRRELDVIAALCRPALSDEAFVTPASAKEIAAELVVTEAAVKQHLLHLYAKLRIVEGLNRRVRLANEAVALGLARPELPDERPSPPPPPILRPVGWTGPAGRVAWTASASASASAAASAGRAEAAARGENGSDRDQAGDQVGANDQDGASGRDGAPGESTATGRNDERG